MSEALGGWASGSPLWEEWLLKATTPPQGRCESVPATELLVPFLQTAAAKPGADVRIVTLSSVGSTLVKSSAVPAAPGPGRPDWTIRAVLWTHGMG